MGNNSEHLEKQLAEAKASQTSEEISAFAEESQIDLSPDMLEMVNGGMMDYETRGITRCRQCGSTNLETYSARKGCYCHAVRCKDCGWSIS